ncbi:hypothetical protein [Kitasatospora sp. NPDC050463]|uniref:hypothetical protein n=1 Tax=Kitasatospora sp. NPDC050463 TaxID=3155786 RepID=UPI0033C20CC7
MTRTYRRTGTRGAGSLNPGAATAPNTFPRSWSRAGTTATSHRSSPVRTPTCCVASARVFLVQWSMGGSMGDAANLLGISPKGGQYASTVGVYRWLEEQGAARFTTVLQDLAQELDVAPTLTDYQYRRFVLRNWCLSLDLWKEITENLPPVPGPFQPIMDDRKRQEASAFVWANVTQGEPRFAPRPIESTQPDPVRNTWLQRRSSTWAKLTRPDPMAHYAALRDLLLQPAEHLTREIDSAPDTARLQLP